MSRDDCVPLGVEEAGKSNVSRHAVTIVVSIGRRCKGESNQAALVDHYQWGLLREHLSSVNRQPQLCRPINHNLQPTLSRWPSPSLTARRLRAATPLPGVLPPVWSARLPSASPRADRRRGRPSELRARASSRPTASRSTGAIRSARSSCPRPRSGCSRRAAATATRARPMRQQPRQTIAAAARTSPRARTSRRARMCPRAPRRHPRGHPSDPALGPDARQLSLPGRLMSHSPLTRRPPPSKGRPRPPRPRPRPRRRPRSAAGRQPRGDTSLTRLSTAPMHSSTRKTSPSSVRRRRRPVRPTAQQRQKTARARHPSPLRATPSSLPLTYSSAQCRSRRSASRSSSQLRHLQLRRARRHAE
jgi:hypothetical protein